MLEIHQPTNKVMLWHVRSFKVKNTKCVNQTKPINMATHVYIRISVPTTKNENLNRADIHNEF